MLITMILITIKTKFILTTLSFFGNHHKKPHMNVLKLNPLSLPIELVIKQIPTLLCSQIAQSRWLLTKMSAFRLRHQNSSLASNNLTQETPQVCDKPCTIRIEIDPEKIQFLLATRQLCAADFHCLDQAFHRCIRELCLQTYLRPLVNSKVSGIDTPKPDRSN